MKLTNLADLSKITDAPTFMRMCSQVVQQIANVINGAVEFDANIASQTVSVTFKTANADTVVPHGLKRVVSKYLVASSSAARRCIPDMQHRRRVLFICATVAATVQVVLF